MQLGSNMDLELGRSGWNSSGGGLSSQMLLGLDDGFKCKSRGGRLL